MLRNLADGMVMLCLLLFGGRDAGIENEEEVGPAVWRPRSAAEDAGSSTMLCFVRYGEHIIISRNCRIPWLVPEQWLW